MKLLGLLGGVSPQSTEFYYRLLNEAAREKLGGDHSAKLMISSVDFDEVAKAYHERDWSQFIALFVDSAQRLQAAGVEALVICSNTSHKAADAVREATGLPVIHLLDVLAEKIKIVGVGTPLLIGTPEVMNGDFYRPYMYERHGIDFIVPSEVDQNEIDRVIFQELCYGNIVKESRQNYLDIISRAQQYGVDGVVLGCTEIGLLISQSHTDLTVFDTTRLHASAASGFAFDEGA